MQATRQLRYESKFPKFNLSQTFNTTPTNRHGPMNPIKQTHTSQLSPTLTNSKIPTSLKPNNSNNKNNYISFPYRNISFLSFFWEMGCCKINLYTTTAFFFLFLFALNFQPLEAARPWDRVRSELRKLTNLESLQKGTPGPGGRNECSYSSKGGQCHMNHKNFAGHAPPRVTGGTIDKNSILVGFNTKNVGFDGHSSESSSSA